MCGRGTEEERTTPRALGRKRARLTVEDTAAAEVDKPETTAAAAVVRNEAIGVGTMAFNRVEGSLSGQDGGETGRQAPPSEDGAAEAVAKGSSQCQKRALLEDEGTWVI